MRIIEGEELEKLTGYLRGNEQSKVLSEMDITFIKRPDKSLVTTDDWLNKADKTHAIDIDEGFNIGAIQ